MEVFARLLRPLRGQRHSDPVTGRPSIWDVACQLDCCARWRATRDLPRAIRAVQPTGTSNVARV